MSSPPNIKPAGTPALSPLSSRLLAEWSQRYRSALVSYFRKRLRTSAEVEDLVQEVFLRLARQHELNTIRFVEPYLFQTASHVLTDHARLGAARRVQDHETYEDCAHPTEVCAPETVLADRQLVSRLLEALAQLPERTQTIFILRRWDELPNADIARMLGVSVSAVEKHIGKALMHLKERLK